MLFRRGQKNLVAAKRRNAGDVAIEAGARTGERLIGFKNPVTGCLEDAVQLRGPKDVDDFYRVHGLLNPLHNA